MNFGCEEGELEFRHSSIRCSELYSSKLLYEAIINAIQKAIGYEGETKILADNPASMFQVAQTMLDTVQTPIFIILERAHELFVFLYDAITVLLRHTKYLSGNKLCLILESRVHLHRLNYPSTGLSMEFNRIRLKEAIVMWPDMHSFLELDKFEPISNS